MPTNGLPPLVPFSTLLRAAALTAYHNLLPEGGQGTARRNAAAAVATDRLRARARAEALVAVDHAHHAQQEARSA
jgi:hypothetical protein